MKYAAQMTKKSQQPLMTLSESRKIKSEGSSLPLASSEEYRERMKHSKFSLHLLYKHDFNST